MTFPAWPPCLSNCTSYYSCPSPELRYAHLVRSKHASEAGGAKVQGNSIVIRGGTCKQWKHL